MGRDSQNLLTRPIRSLLLAYCLCAIVFLGYGIEMAGALLTDQNHDPILRASRALDIIRDTGGPLSFLAPFFALGALAIVRSSSREPTGRGKKVFLWALLIVTFLVSFAEWGWSCGGHPTWIQGYP